MQSYTHHNQPLMGMPQDLFHGSESIFGSAAATLVGHGWSVFPQEPHGGRRPGNVMGDMIRWQADHDLQNRLPTPEEIRRWSIHCGTLNVACVMGAGSGSAFCVDIDAMDPDVSRAVHALATEHLGETWFIRQGRAPKLALVYRHPADAPVRSAARKLAVGEDNSLEILANGKPITIHGRHHRTGHYFKWLGKGNPFLHRPETAPRVGQEQVDAFMAAVQAKFGFVNAAPLTSSVTLTGTEDVSGLRLPLAHGEKATDGRFNLLNRVAFRVVLDNAQVLHAAQASGSLGEAKARLTAGVVAAFAGAAELTGRWAGNGVVREAAANVNRTVDRVLAGELAPMALAPRPQASSGPRPLIRKGGYRPTHPLLRHTK